MYKILLYNLYGNIFLMSLYNKSNIVRWARYDMLAELVNKRKHTIQIFFSRNKLNIENNEDVKKYLNDNLSINLK